MMTDPAIPDEGAMSLLLWPWTAAAAAARSWTPPNLAPDNLAQPINPGWTFGNVIVSNANSRDPATEQAIVGRHSYGQQIGRMMDVLALLIGRLPVADRDEPCVQRFDELRREIRDIKDSALERRLASMCDDLRTLRDREPDPARFRQLAAALRDVLDEPPPGPQAGEKAAAAAPRKGRRQATGAGGRVR